MKGMTISTAEQVCGGTKGQETQGNLVLELRGFSDLSKKL